MTTGTIVTLKAEDLWSKWGFEEGISIICALQEHAPDDHPLLVALENAPNDMWAPHIYDQLVIQAVQRHLLPLLPTVETIVMTTSHNPIRARNWEEDCPLEYRDLRADLTLEQVLAVAAELVQP